MLLAAQLDDVGRVVEPTLLQKPGTWVAPAACMESQMDLLNLQGDKQVTTPGAQVMFFLDLITLLYLTHVYISCWIHMQLFSCEVQLIIK